MNEKKEHVFTSVTPCNIIVMSEFYGSSKVATHKIGNSSLPHTCFNVAEEELKLIYKDLNVIFGEDVSFEGETTNELQEKIRKLEAREISLKQSFDLKQTEVTNLSLELENALGETIEDEDPRLREFLKLLFDSIGDSKLRLTKGSMERILTQMAIPYDDELTATEMFKDSVVGFFNLDN